MPELMAKKNDLCKTTALVVSAPGRGRQRSGRNGTDAEMRLFILLLDRRIIESIMESARLFTLLGLTHDEIADVDDVAQLTDLT